MRRAEEAEEENKSLKEEVSTLSSHLLASKSHHISSKMELRRSAILFMRWRDEVRERKEERRLMKVATLFREKVINSYLSIYQFINHWSIWGRI